MHDNNQEVRFSSFVRLPDLIRPTALMFKGFNVILANSTSNHNHISCLYPEPALIDTIYPSIIGQFNYLNIYNGYCSIFISWSQDMMFALLGYSHICHPITMKQLDVWHTKYPKKFPSNNYIHKSNSIPTAQF